MLPYIIEPKPGTREDKQEATPGNFIDIREPHTGKLLCRFDPERRLLEFRRRGVKTLIALIDTVRAVAKS